jgi:carbon monoxide dehydrogenase subunit G
VKLENEFTVHAAPDAVWRLLTDLERIAPCMPGAELLGREGESYRGRVKVKVGPVQAQYEGKATFVQRDEAALRGVLLAEGRETRGQGNAKATVTASLSPVPEGTRVRVETDLAIVGRLAQMGRGLIGEVTAKLLGEFVANLERSFPAPAAAAPTTPSVAAAAPAAVEAPAPPREVAPVDLLATAGGPILKRLLPIGVALGALALAAWWLLGRDA